MPVSTTNARPGITNCLIKSIHVSSTEVRDDNQKTDTKSREAKKSETKKTSPKSSSQASGLSELMTKTKSLATSLAGAHARESTPDASNGANGSTDEPGSQGMPPTVVTEIRNSILSSLPKIEEELKRAGLDKKFSKADMEKAMEKLQTTGEDASQEFCKINGRISQDGKLNFFVSINFVKVQNIKTENVEIGHSDAVGINGSTINLTGHGTVQPGECSRLD